MNQTLRKCTNQNTPGGTPGDCKQVKRVRCRGTFKKDGEQVSRDLPLKNVEICGQMIPYVGTQVILKQEFCNNFDLAKALVVSYIFPTEEKWTIYSMTARLSSGIEIEGTVKSSKQASAEFDAVTRTGRQAVLLKQISSDVYQFDIGNVAAGDTVEITVAYACPYQSNVNGNTEFYVPRTMTPRFGASDLTALGVDAVSYKMKIDMNILNGPKLLSIDSPSHPDQLEWDTYDKNDKRQASFSLELTGDCEGIKKDIVIEVKHARDQHTHALYEYSSLFNSNVLIVSFVVPKSHLPEQPEEMEENEEERRREMLFLVDVSAGMGGYKLEMAKTILKKCLTEIPHGTKLNLIAFAKDHEYCRTKSVTIGEDCVDAVGEWISCLTAKAYAPALDRALTEVLRNEKEQGNRDIFLLTSGGVKNTDECVDLVKQFDETSRLFTIGIGCGYSTGLTNKSAVAGNGFATRIICEEEIESKIHSLMNKVSSEYIKNVEICVESSEEGSTVQFDVYPRNIQHLRIGERAVIFAGANQSDGRDTALTMTISAKKMNGENYYHEISMDLSQNGEGQVEEIEEIQDNEVAVVDENPENGLSGYEGECEIFTQKGVFHELLEEIVFDKCNMNDDVADEFMSLSRSHGLLGHRILARHKIDELEATDTPDSRKEIIDLSKKFNIPTNRTSMIAKRLDDEGISDVQQSSIVKQLEDVELQTRRSQSMYMQSQDQFKKRSQEQQSSASQFVRRSDVMIQSTPSLVTIQEIMQNVKTQEIQEPIRRDEVLTDQRTIVRDIQMQIFVDIMKQSDCQTRSRFISDVVQVDQQTTLQQIAEIYQSQYQVEQTLDMQQQMAQIIQSQFIQMYHTTFAAIVLQMVYQLQQNDARSMNTPEQVLMMKEVIEYMMKAFVAMNMPIARQMISNENTEENMVGLGNLSQTMVYVMG